MAVPQMKTQVIAITPKFAAELLENNEGNRRIRSTTVERYAAQMRSGDWLLTAEPIMLTTSMRLLNGQHRLHAVVASGKTIKFSVAYDVPEDSFAALDRGVGRTAGDALGTTPRIVAVARLSLLVTGTRSYLVTDKMISDRLDVLGHELYALEEFCGTARKIFSSASFRLAAICRILNGTKRAYVHDVYRHLVLNHISELPPIAQAAIAAQSVVHSGTDWRDPMTLLARGWMIFDNDRARNTRVQVKDAQVAVNEIAAVIKKAEKGR